MNATTINWSGSPVGRPTTDTLTDRYVWAVLKSLPEAKRTDIDRELRASIADDVEARVDGGEDADAAERAVLLALGDPATLAASYQGRTPGLIGPDLYPGYVGLLKMLYAVVLPIVAVAYVVIQLLTGAKPGGVIGGTVAVVLGLIVHLGFWTTLVFAIAERTGTSMKGVPRLEAGPFDPARLPAIPAETGGSRTDFIASLVFLVLIPVAWVWDQVAPFADASILHAAVWPFWVGYFAIFWVAAIVQAVLLFRRGRWTWPLVVMNAVIAVAVTVPLAGLLLNGALINPGLLDQLGWERALGAGSVGAVATSVALGAGVLWAIGDSIWKKVKADRLGQR